jgi:hypothetical protein
MTEHTFHDDPLAYDLACKNKKELSLFSIFKYAGLRVRAIAKVHHMSNEELKAFTKGFRFCGKCPWCEGMGE